MTSITRTWHHISYTPMECCGHCLPAQVHGTYFSCEWISDTAKSVHITSVKNQNAPTLNKIHLLLHCSSAYALVTYALVTYA